MSDRTRDAYDRWAPTYDADPNPQTVMEHHHVVELVTPRPGERILDAGCGTGRYAAVCDARGADVIGIDFSEGMLAAARAAWPGISFVKADLAGRLPFADATFDKAVCAQTLKHLPALAGAVRELARVLKPGGALVFSVTHPHMDWEGYEMRATPDFVLSREADIHHHALADYRSAVASARLVMEEEVEVPVSETIAHLLTAESYQRVEGRKQVIIFKARKEGRSDVVGKSLFWRCIGTILLLHYSVNEMSPGFPG